MCEQGPATVVLIATTSIFWRQVPAWCRNFTKQWLRAFWHCLSLSGRAPPRRQTVMPWIKISNSFKNYWHSAAFHSKFVWRSSDEGSKIYHQWWVSTCRRLFKLLPSGRRYRSIGTECTRAMNTLHPTTVRTMNDFRKTEQARHTKWFIHYTCTYLVNYFYCAQSQNEFQYMNLTWKPIHSRKLTSGIDVCEMYHGCRIWTRH